MVESPTGIPIIRQRAEKTSKNQQGANPCLSQRFIHSLELTRLVGYDSIKVS